MAKKLKFDTSFHFGANVARKPKGGKGKDRRGKGKGRGKGGAYGS